MGPLLEFVIAIDNHPWLEYSLDLIGIGAAGLLALAPLAGGGGDDAGGSGRGSSLPYSP
jgi:hypothetical protein